MKRFLIGVPPAAPHFPSVKKLAPLYVRFLPEAWRVPHAPVQLEYKLGLIGCRGRASSALPIAVPSAHVTSGPKIGRHRTRPSISLSSFCLPTGMGAKQHSHGNADDAPFVCLHGAFRHIAWCLSTRSPATSIIAFRLGRIFPLEEIQGPKRGASGILPRSGRRSNCQIEHI